MTQTGTRSGQERRDEDKRRKVKVKIDPDRRDGDERRDGDDRREDK